VFQAVTVFLEPNSDQLFFLNTDLLRRRFFGPKQTPDAVVSCTHFVYASQNPALLPSAPPELLEILNHLLIPTQGPPPPCLTYTPPEPLDASALVPLAALLLEYPLAYVPLPAGQSGYLSGVPLDVYECGLSWAEQPLGYPSERHMVLKFSCPCAIGLEEKALHPSALVERLKNCFGTRLADAGFSGKLIVHHCIETLPRVAL